MTSAKANSQSGDSCEPKKAWLRRGVGQREWAVAKESMHLSQEQIGAGLVQFGSDSAPVERGGVRRV